MHNRLTFINFATMKAKKVKIAYRFGGWVAFDDEGYIISQPPFPEKEMLVQHLELRGYKITGEVK